MEIRRSEVNEAQEKQEEMASCEVQSMEEAKEIFDQIMEKPENDKEYIGSKANQISFGSTASTS